MPRWLVPPCQQEIRSVTVGVAVLPRAEGTRPVKISRGSLRVTRWVCPASVAFLLAILVASMPATAATRPLKTCAIISKAKIERLTGRTARPSGIPGFDPYTIRVDGKQWGCYFTLTRNMRVVLDVVCYRAADVSTHYTFSLGAISVAPTRPRPLSGLGDMAHIGNPGSGKTVIVLAGRRILRVSVGRTPAPPAPDSLVIAIARAANSFNPC